MTASHSASQLGAISRYKEITAAATSAVEAMRQRESRAVATLTEQVAEDARSIEAAAKDRELVQDAVRIRWNGTREALWQERWMRLGTMPEPDLAASPASAAESIRAVQAAYVELRTEIAGPRWSAMVGRS